MAKSSKLVFGVGINDLERDVTWKIDGKKIICPIYRTWQNMLGRCHDLEFHERHPSYTECSTILEWVRLSTFENWMITQNWQGKQLDKDILFPGNKIYSPDTCAFVYGYVNRFVCDSGATRGEWPIGVSWTTRDEAFKAEIRNPFTKRREGLGYYDNPEAAHLAWKKRKHELALMYAEQQTDPRVAEALRTRYL